MTPAYDVQSSHPYGGHSMAMPINGLLREDIGRDDFIALGASIGLAGRAVKKALDELAERSEL